VSNAWVHLDRLDGDRVGRELEALVRSDQDFPERIARAQKRIARLESERLELVQMAYADEIPMSLLKTEQARINIESRQAGREIEKAQHTSQDVIKTYEQARALMARGAEPYRFGGPEARRLLTRAFVALIEVDADEERATLTSRWLEIEAASTYLRKRRVSYPLTKRNAVTAGNGQIGGPQRQNPTHLLRAGVRL